MKRILAQIGLVVIIVIALGFVVKQLKPRQSVGYERVLVDVKANKVFTAVVKTGEIMTFPAKSPYSEGNNAYPVLKCLKDGTIFAYDEAASDEDAIPVCPICGGYEITVVELPAGQKSMDVPGPIQVAKPGKIGHTGTSAD